MFLILKVENQGISDDLGGFAVLVAVRPVPPTSSRTAETVGQTKAFILCKVGANQYISLYHFLNGLLATHCFWFFSFFLIKCCGWAWDYGKNNTE